MEVLSFSLAYNPRKYDILLSFVLSEDTQKFKINVRNYVNAILDLNQHHYFDDSFTAHWPFILKISAYTCSNSHIHNTLILMVELCLFGPTSM